MVTLWRILLLAVFLLDPAHAFLPNLSNTSAGLADTETHESITRRGVLSITLKVFQDLAQEKGKVFDVASLKGELVAEEVFKAYYGTAVSTKRFKMALDEIIRSNNEVDFLLPNDATSHSEAEKFKQVKQLILDKKRQTIFNIKKENYVAARVSMGRLLHTLQDFYSHSNWVELGNSDTNKGLTMPNEILGVIAGPTEKTCGSCASSGGCNPVLTPILRAMKLTSGYPDSAVPDGKCGHGGGAIASSAGGLNKDTTSPNLSPQYHRHKDAAKLASTATLEVLQDIRESVADALFVKFLDLEPPSTISFVIDTTGSMGDDIEAAKERVYSIIENKKGTLNEPSQYVLVPFNDPDYGPAFITDDPVEFKNALEKLTPNGGGDTPEMCLHGVELALLNTPPDTEIYVFTDAEAKDFDLKNRILTLSQETNSRLTFLITAAYRRRRRRSSGNAPLQSSRSDVGGRTRGCGQNLQSEAGHASRAQHSNGGLKPRSCQQSSHTSATQAHQTHRQSPATGAGPRRRERRRSSQTEVGSRRGARLHSSHLSAEHRRGTQLRRLHPGVERRNRLQSHGSHSGLRHRDRAHLHSSQRGTEHRSRVRRQSPDPGMALYQDLALASGGQVISSSKSELSSVTKIIEDSVSFSTVTLLQVSMAQAVADHVFTFYMDSTVSNVSLYITGNPQYKLTNPDGTLYTGGTAPSPIAISQTAGSLERISLTSPVQLGTWKLVVTSQSMFALRVTGNSLLDLAYDFVEEVSGTHPGLQKVSGRPRAGAPATMMVEVTGLKSLPSVSLKDLHLADIQGKILQTVPLKRTESPGIFRADSYSLPQEQFIIILNGEDGMGHSLQRVSPSLNTISASKVQLLSSITAIYPGENYEIRFMVQNVGSPSDFNILVKGNQGFVSGFSPPSARLVMGQAVYGSARLAVPGNAEPGTLLTLTVQSETADKKDFNYALIQLPVTQKVTDFDPPLCNITSFKQNCSKILMSNCGSHFWSLEAELSDNETGVERIFTHFRNATLIQKEQAEPKKKILQVNYTISCCFNQAQITAVDTAGNVGKCEASFEPKTRSASTPLGSSLLVLNCVLLCWTLIVTLG